ncbi:MAG: hypothetical protein P8Y52_09210 [Xanthomonadales bacterium]
MKRLNVLCVAMVLAAATIFGAAPAFADDHAANNTYEMSVVVNRAFGELVSHGRYERAILRIASHPNRFPFATATNLCVAHTMVGQYRHALRYCDEALEAAEDAAATGRRRDRDYTTEWALAFSNRGVLRARMGDAKGAAHDFRMAIDLHGDSQLPVHNMARLHHEIEDDALAAK